MKQELSEKLCLVGYFCVKYICVTHEKLIQNKVHHNIPMVQKLLSDILFLPLIHIYKLLSHLHEIAMLTPYLSVWS